MVVLVVVLAAAGALGVSTRVSRSSGSVIDLTVTYPSRARPGMAAPLVIDVTSADGAGLPERLEVVISSSYLAAFDVNGIEPTPAESWNDATATRFVFVVPERASSLRIDVDARLEPDVRWRRTGIAEVTAGTESLIVQLDTWVLP